MAVHSRRDDLELAVVVEVGEDRGGDEAVLGAVQVRLPRAWGGRRAVAAVAELMQRLAREGRVRLLGEDPLAARAPAVHAAAGVVREDLRNAIAVRVGDGHGPQDRCPDVAGDLTARERPPAQMKRRRIAAHRPAGQL